MSVSCTKILRLGKGISSQTRYNIVQVLMKGPMAVSLIVKEVKLSQPAVSQHLRTLKSCGLVESSKRGQEVVYSLNTKYMIGILRELTTGVSKCKAFLGKNK